ncbi:MAG: hypothetical protein ABEH38_07280 [Flavobacteriales bacterium]
MILKLPFFGDRLIPRKAFVAAFLLKFLAGVLLWAIYSFHYPMKGHTDAFNYYDEAMVLHNALYEEPVAYLDLLLGTEFKPKAAERYIAGINHWKKPYNYGVINDNRTVIRANMICRLVSFGYYHVHTAIFCFVSFIGMMALFKAFVRFLPGFRYGIFLAAFLIPSVVFWGSGVLKEGILLFGAGCFVFHVVRLFEDRRCWSLPPLLLFGFLLVGIKTYVLLAMLPGLFVYILLHLFRKRHSVLTFIGAHLLLGFIALRLPHWGIPYNIPYMLQLKQKDFYNVARMHDAGSVIQAPAIDRPFDILLEAPHALWNALFRPHLFEMEKWLYLPPAMENLFLLLGGAIALFFWRVPPRQLRPFYCWSLSFILILGSVIGLTTPVLGAIIRYQVPILPFYTFVVLASIDEERWKKAVLKVRRSVGFGAYGKAN